MYKVRADAFTRLGEVGTSKYSTVYRVEVKKTKKIKAMKVIPKHQLIANKALYRSLWVERRVLSEVTSRFVVKIDGAFHDDRMCYLILQMLDGGSLRRYLDTKGRMKERFVRFYLAQTVLDLEELHKRKIVYRG
eukprot:969472_1